MNSLSLKLALIITVGLVGLFVFATTQSSRHQQTESPPSTNALKWHAEKAKKEGKKEVVIPFPIVDYAGSAAEDINDTLAHYTLVVAQPVTKHTYQASGNTLVTWYKFRIVEALTELKAPACFGCSTLTPPTDIALDYSNEFLVPRNGGTATVDGIQIQQIESTFPDFRENQKYLLFISLYPNRVALTAGGPQGVLTVDGEDNLKPFSHRPSKIADEIKSKFNNSLAVIKRRLKEK
jgi:hypothetical protein